MLWICSQDDNEAITSNTALSQSPDPQIDYSLSSKIRIPIFKSSASSQYPAGSSDTQFLHKINVPFYWGCLGNTGYLIWPQCMGLGEGLISVLSTCIIQ